MVGRGRGRFEGRATAVGACLVVIAFGLSGCTPDEEPTPSETTTSVTEEPSTETASPTPTPTPTEAPPLTPEEVNVEAAKQTVITYTAAVDAVGTASFADWQVQLSAFWGTPEVWEPNIENFSNAAAAGLYSEGLTKVSSFDVREYTPDPSQSGHERVILEYCVDNSGVTVFQADGTPLARTLPPRYVYSSTLARQDSGLWTFASLESFSDRTC